MDGLFSTYAHRYDLHTPPDHYQHDHQLVLDLARRCGPAARILDVGCGTGVLVAKAVAAGFDATGIDASPEMVRVAAARSLGERVTVRRMQEIDDEQKFDLIASLSWSLNYCDGRAELLDVLGRIQRALRPGGRFVAQIAHAAHVGGDLFEDRERGPDGRQDDVTLLYRFQRTTGEDHPMRAEYVYACKSANELLYEEHRLTMADATAFAACAERVGIRDVVIYDSWRFDPFQRSVSPFIVGQR